MKWSYGVTTVPSRRYDLLPRTLESLKKAGFENPRLFIDGLPNESAKGYFDQFGLQVTARYPVVKTVANWILALWELYLREPAAERYAVFQDDFVTYSCLRYYLEMCEYPERGYWNLYTFPSNQKLCPDPNYIGWYPTNQLGKGAVALVFDRETVVQLLSQQHLVRKPQCVKRGTKAVDGGIVTAMSNVGYKEYVHNPSLVQHTGKVSSMRNKPHPLSPSFRGEDFNALDLIQIKERKDESAVSN